MPLYCLKMPNRSLFKRTFKKSGHPRDLQDTPIGERFRIHSDCLPSKISWSKINNCRPLTIEVCSCVSLVTIVIDDDV